MTDDGGLDAAFTVERDRFRLALELSVRAGTVTAIVGPNGAGKSTALRTIAGLLRPASGRITSASRVLDDAASGIHVPPSQRGIGVVFQDYLLFPHLSALENVAFGPLAGGMPRRQAIARAQEWLDRLGIGEYAPTRPRSLSGGQAQRVALARALVLEPSLLLLDEPLAALDASTRLDVRGGLRTQLRAYGGATVLVTHDPIDALSLADEMVVLDGGAVVQRGTPAQVARAPRTEYVADLLGLNLLTDAAGATHVFSPADVVLSPVRPPTASAVAEECRVLGLEQVSGRIRLRLAVARDSQRLTAEVDVREFAPRPLAPGDSVWVSVLAASLHES